jgi:prolyl-tRNA synthetase
MRLSRYFMPTLREAPSDAQIVSHQLMLRAGLIRQEAAGIYAWLPLGLRVLKNIEQVVREEMDRAGAIEVLMPTLQLADLWRESGRFDDYGDEMLRIKDRNDRDLLYGPTAEEVITDIFRAFIKSYKDLPKNFYNIQWKFRDERRPRFGVMRGREFLMKDAYSFDVDEAAARKSFNRMFLAYLNIYARLGLKAIPVKADPGPIGGDLSYEFIILADTGESEVFAHADLVEMGAPGPDIDWDGRPAAPGGAAHPALRGQRRDARPGPLRGRGARGQADDRARDRSRPYFLLRGEVFASHEGQCHRTRRPGPPDPRGSYGVGVSRLVGGIIEASHDDAGIIWPTPWRPSASACVNLRPGDAGRRCGGRAGLPALAARQGPAAGRPRRAAGRQVRRLDLVGIPWQLIVGPKGVADGVVEIKRRATGERQTLPLDAALKAIAG